MFTNKMTKAMQKNIHLSGPGCRVPLSEEALTEIKQVHGVTDATSELNLLVVYYEGDWDAIKIAVYDIQARFIRTIVFRLIVFRLSLALAVACGALNFFSMLAHL